MEDSNWFVLPLMPFKVKDSNTPIHISFAHSFTFTFCYKGSDVTNYESHQYDK